MNQKLKDKNKYENQFYLFFLGVSLEYISVKVRQKLGAVNKNNNIFLGKSSPPAAQQHQVNFWLTRKQEERKNMKSSMVKLYIFKRQYGIVYCSAGHCSLVPLPPPPPSLEIVIVSYEQPLTKKVG